MINNLYKKNNIKNQRGFTLIELMVSVTIFAIVTVISMGAILTVVDGNKKNQTMQVAINNLNFAVESMTRSLKTGYGYILRQSSGSSCDDVVDFTNTDEEAVQYYRTQFGGGNDNYGLYIENAATPYAGFITSPDLNITDLCFTESVALSQPALTIVIKGETTKGKEELRTKFNIYTSITQRQVQYD